MNVTQHDLEGGGGDGEEEVVVVVVGNDGVSAILHLQLFDLHPTYLRQTMLVLQ